MESVDQCFPLCLPEVRSVLKCLNQGSLLNRLQHVEWGWGTLRPTGERTGSRRPAAPCAAVLRSRAWTSRKRAALRRSCRREGGCLRGNGRTREHREWMHFYLSTFHEHFFFEHVAVPGLVTAPSWCLVVCALCIRFSAAEASGVV